MRTTILVLQIYFLAVAFQPLEGQHNRKDAVICSDSRNNLTLTCGDDEVLRINDAKYARLSRRFACSESIIPKIDAKRADCKLESLLPRCNGERVCIIEPSEVANRLERCCNRNKECTTNSLHVRYSCETGAVILPLLHADVTRKALRVLSPYYPNNISSQPGSFTCRVAAASVIPSTPSVLLKLGLFVKFNPSEEECAEKLTFNLHTVPHEFCIHNGETQRNTSENYLVWLPVENLFEFTYSKSFSAEGGKFVFDIEAFQAEESVDLKISCTNQEDFTVLPTLHLPQSEGREPFTVETTPPTPLLNVRHSVEDSSNASKVGIIPGVIGGVVIISVTVVVVLVVLWTKRKRNGTTNDRNASVPDYPVPVTSAQMYITPIFDPAAEPDINVRDNVQDHTYSDVEGEYEYVRNNTHDIQHRNASAPASAETVPDYLVPLTSAQMYLIPISDPAAEPDNTNRDQVDDDTYSDVEGEEYDYVRDIENAWGRNKNTGYVNQDVNEAAASGNYEDLDESSREVNKPYDKLDMTTLTSMN